MKGIIARPSHIGVFAELHYRAVESSNSAETITAVLYPNDNTMGQSYRPPLSAFNNRTLFSWEGTSLEAAIFLDRSQFERHNASVQEHWKDYRRIPRVCVINNIYYKVESLMKLCIVVVAIQLNDVRNDICGHHTLT